MSADAVEDLLYDVVDNVSYSTRPNYVEIDETTAGSVSTFPLMDKVGTAKTTQGRFPDKQLRAASRADTFNFDVGEDDDSLKKKKKKQRGVLLVCVVALLAAVLFTAAALGLVVVFVLISKLQSQVGLVQLASPGMVMRVQALESAVNAFGVQLNASRANEAVFEFLSEAGYAFVSCADIRRLSPSSPSGFYYVRSFNGSAVRVYCDLNRSCGGVAGGWTRVAALDLTDATTPCPGSLELLSTPRRTCRTRYSDSGLCCSSSFSVSDVVYSKVCGRIRAYQMGTPDGFIPDTGIDSFYVDGVSLTHGTFPRQHIWTFVGSINEDMIEGHCSCADPNVSSVTSPAPSFVGQDYFCDTADEGDLRLVFYTDDPLWDGAGCGPENKCCSLNDPPWFYKQLPRPTTDDIEMRVCRSQTRDDEDIAIETVEIFVQ